MKAVTVCLLVIVALALIHESEQQLLGNWTQRFQFPPNEQQHLETLEETRRNDEREHPKWVFPWPYNNGDTPTTTAAPVTVPSTVASTAGNRKRREIMDSPSLSLKATQ